jgi:hypothetical protein
MSSDCFGEYLLSHNLDHGFYAPIPRSERRAWLVALVLSLLGTSVLAAILGGVIGASSSAPTPDPPAVLVRAVTPTAASAPEAAQRSGRGTTADPMWTPAITLREACRANGSRPNADRGAFAVVYHLGNTASSTD